MYSYINFLIFHEIKNYVKAHYIGYPGEEVQQQQWQKQTNYNCA